MIENSIKMKTNDIKRINENQGLIKKEPVSLFPRKRQTIRLLDYYPLLAAKVATFNE